MWERLSVQMGPVQAPSRVLWRAGPAPASQLGRRKSSRRGRGLWGRLHTRLSLVTYRWSAVGGPSPAALLQEALGLPGGWAGAASNVGWQERGAAEKRA